MFDDYTHSPRELPEDWKPPFDYEVLAARTVDGDTVDLLVDVGFREILEDRFRLSDDFDAWEKKRPTMEQGRAAQARLDELLAQAKGMRVKTEIDLQDRAKRGKFGRYIAVLYVNRHGTWESVAAILKGEGHAKR